MEGLVGLEGVVVSARPIAQWLERWIASTIGGPMHFIPEKWASERVSGVEWMMGICEPGRKRNGIRSLMAVISSFDSRIP